MAEPTDLVARVDGIDGKLEQLSASVDERFEQVDKRFEAVLKEIAAEGQQTRGHVDKEIAAEGQKTRRHFDVVAEQMKSEFDTRLTELEKRQQ